MTYVGIDVSKATFTVAYSSVGTGRTRTFENTVKGTHGLIRSIAPAGPHCVLEATGNYSTLLIYLLSEAEIAVSMDKPLKIKNFTRAILAVTKTDETDARLITLYGERIQPAPYRLRSDSILVLKQKRTVMRQVKKQLVATRNLKGSMEVLSFFDPKCRKTVERTIDFLEKQIKETEEEVASLTQDEYRKQTALLTSVKGIGVTLAARSSLPPESSLALTTPSSLPVIWDCSPPANSPGRRSTSGGTSTATGIRPSGNSCTWRPSRR